MTPPSHGKVLSKQFLPLDGKSGKFFTSLLLGICLSATIAQADTTPTHTATGKNVPMTTASLGDENALSNEQKMFYAIGVQLIGNFKRQGVDIDFAMVSEGMRDALAGGPFRISDDELRKLIISYQEMAARSLVAQRHEESEQNKGAGATFLEENLAKPGVHVLPSGVQYTVLEAGNGAVPGPDDTIQYTYHGTLIDGTSFAKSPDDGSPVEGKVRLLLPGLRQAVQHMPVGSTWQLVIPAQYGYGPRGAGRLVGPNAVLVYKLTLVSTAPSTEPEIKKSN